MIGTLAERYNEAGHVCVRRDLATMKTLDDLHATLARITDSYYRMFVDEPLMRDIWRATQADRALQALDRADGEFLAGCSRMRWAKWRPIFRMRNGAHSPS